MFIVRNTANNKYYQRFSDHHHKLDVERRDATVFKTKAEAETEATIVHDMFS